MNPFLADVKLLCVYIWGLEEHKLRNEYDIGNLIGHYNYPIEDLP